jgi:glycosyltransferase involved in cell wall biosynthesis
MKPLVSIVTPSYNQAKYLEATMQSVLQQDYSSLEYIVVDGASEDGSQELIQKYQDKLAWWVAEPDQGQADAINKGFRRSSGEILAWLNSDDLYLPGTVTAAVDIFRQHPEAGMIYGDAVSADGNGHLLNELRFETWGVADLLAFNMICQPAVFMRRDLLEKVGYLDTSYHFFLDHQLWIRLAREGSLIHVPEVWAVSRYHAEAKNVTMAAQCGTEAWRILEWAESQPDLREIIAKDKKLIHAGAYQISARYLLDGGKPGPAFRNYLKAVQNWPPSLLTFWHRLLFSALSILGLGFLGRWYYYLKGKKEPGIASESSLAGWPGLQLNQ